jgi:hypothetical protein
VKVGCLGVSYRVIEEGGSHQTCCGRMEQNYRVTVDVIQRRAREPHTHGFRKFDITDALDRSRPWFLTSAPPQLWLESNFPAEARSDLHLPCHSAYSISENWAAAARFSMRICQICCAIASACARIEAALSSRPLPATTRSRLLQEQ